MSIAAGYGSAEQLQVQVRSLLEECANLRKDAERYRWLRDMLEKNDAEAYEIIEFAYRGGLTGAIDAAMNGANVPVKPGREATSA